MNDLSIVDRAKASLSIDHTEKELSDLAKKFADIERIVNEDDYSLVKGACREFQKVRVSIEKAGKSARDDANKFAKAVIEEQKRLLGIIAPEENRLKAIRKEVDDRAVREAAEKLKAEEERVGRIQERILHIRSRADFSFGLSSKELANYLDQLENIQITDGDYQEFFDEAVIAKNAGIKKLSSAIEEKKELEKLKAEREEQERKQAEQQAILDAQKRELEEEKAKLERAKKEEEEKRLAAERAEAKKVKEEKDRLEAEAKARDEAERMKAEQEADAARQEALRPEKEKLIDWIKKLRFIDVVNLKDESLLDIQQEIMSKLNEISIEYVDRVEKY